MADILFQCEQQGTLGVIYTAKWYLGGGGGGGRGGDRLAYFTCLDQIATLVTAHIATLPLCNLWSQAGLFSLVETDQALGYSAVKWLAW